MFLFTFVGPGKNTKVTKYYWSWNSQFAYFFDNTGFIFLYDTEVWVLT